jgi:hypothetical protein
VRAPKHQALVLRIDPEADELRLCLNRGTPTDGASDELELFRLGLARIRELSQEGAVALIGSRVMAAMAHLGEHQSGYAGYKAIGEQAKSLIEKELLSGVANGDPDAMYELALDRAFESVHLRSIDYLEEAESYLTQAARKGHARAAEFLTRTWPREKEARRRQILDGP